MPKEVMDLLIMPSPIDDIYKDALQAVDNNREDQILNRLEQLGHVFSNKAEWHDFIKSRLTIATGPHPLYRQLYLDQGTPHEILVAQWLETVEHTYNYNELTGAFEGKIAAGNPPKW